MPCDTRISDFAAQVGVSPRTVNRWARAGYIHAERRGPRLIFVDPSSLKSQAVS